jgi:hypothetical protein
MSWQPTAERGRHASSGNVLGPFGNVLTPSGNDAVTFWRAERPRNRGFLARTLPCYRVFGPVRARTRRRSHA